MSTQGSGIGLGLASAFVFGLLPAVLASIRNPLADLKDPRPTWSWTGLRVSTRQILLVLQVALAVVLTVTAALYARTLVKVAAIDSGYQDPERVLLARIVLTGMTPEVSSQFFATFMPQLEATPGVVSASIGWNPPYAIGRTFLALPGDDSRAIDAGATAAAPRFFETLGIPLAAGREFDGSGADLREGVIINRVLAEQLWPGDPLAVGRRVMFGTEERTVTGVVAKERCRWLLGPPEPCSYRPFPPGSTGYLRLRVEGAPMPYVDRLRAIVHGIDPQVAVADERALDAHLRDLTAAERLSAMATMGLAALGLVLLAAGCASLFAWMVRESVREIAVRMALGASRAQVTRRILTRGVLLTGSGLAIGAYATGAVATRIGERLYDVSVWDPVAWLTATGVIAVVSLVSVGSAAALAARTDPSMLLRAE